MVVMKKDKIASSFVMFGEKSPSKKLVYSDWHKLGSEKIGGLKCERFHRDLKNPNESKEKYSSYSDDFWVTNDIDVPNYKRLMEPLISMTRVPYKSGIGVPVKHKKLFQVFYRGSKRPFRREDIDSLSLISAERMEIKPSTYEVPKDYQTVKDETELLFTEDSSDGNMSNFGRH
jgi:hypothetical protein